MSPQIIEHKKTTTNDVWNPNTWAFDGHTNVVG